MSAALRPVKTTVIVHERAAQALDLDALAREAGLHPDLVRRLVSIGLFDPRPGAPSFPRDAGVQLARAVRLRRDLGLNYAGALLACDLLDRIEQLERRLRRYEPVDRKRR